MACTIALIILCALVLILLLLVIFMRNDLGAMKDLCERMRDKWASTENICRKLDVAIMWLIEEKGVTLEQASYWSNSWYITPLKDKWHIKGCRRELNDAWAALYPHREAIAQELLDAFRQWDKEREEAKRNAKKGGKK